MENPIQIFEFSDDETFLIPMLPAKVHTTEDQENQVKIVTYRKETTQNSASCLIGLKQDELHFYLNFPEGIQKLHS